MGNVDGERKIMVRKGSDEYRGSGRSQGARAEHALIPMVRLFVRASTIIFWLIPLGYFILLEG